MITPTKLNQLLAYLDELPTYSNTHHLVKRWEDYYIKISSLEAPQIQGIRNEEKVLSSLSINNIFLRGHILITEDRGEPVTCDYNKEIIQKIIEEISSIHEVNPQIELEEVSREDIVTYRIASLSDKSMFDYIKPYWKKLLKDNKPFPKKVLVHGDLHLGNVVQNKNRVNLIDFESAHYSLPEWDYASLWLSLKLNKDHRFDELLIAQASDEAVFFAAAKQKLASSLTWSIWQDDRDGVEARIALAKELLQK